MSEIQIPERSLARLRAAYQQFEQISGLVAEAMGLDPSAVSNVRDDGDQRTVPVPYENGVAV